MEVQCEDLHRLHAGGWSRALRQQGDPVEHNCGELPFTQSTKVFLCGGYP